MGKLKGQNEYNKFLEGKKLTVKQAIKAQCWICNGEEQGSGIDCKGLSCPLYPFFKKWVERHKRSKQIVSGSGERQLPLTPKQRN